MEGILTTSAAFTAFCWVLLPSWWEASVRLWGEGRFSLLVHPQFPCICPVSLWQAQGLSAVPVNPQSLPAKKLKCCSSFYTEDIGLMHISCPVLHNLPVLGTGITGLYHFDNAPKEESELGFKQLTSPAARDFLMPWEALWEMRHSRIRTGVCVWKHTVGLANFILKSKAVFNTRRTKLFKEMNGWNYI